MTYKVSETQHGFFRVDIDTPEVINQLADHIDASCGFDALQTVVNRKSKQGYIWCRATFLVKSDNIEHAKNKLSEIVGKFKNE